MNEEGSVVELLQQIDERIGHLVALTAAGQVAGLTQREAVEKLGSLGLTAKAISGITGYSTTSVAPVLSRMKGKAKKKS